MDTNVYTEEEFRIDDYLDEKARRKKLKEEKKRRKSYKFSDKKHSKNGIISSVFALASLAALICTIIISVSHKGDGGLITGAIAMIGLVAAIAGFIVAAFSFRETDKLFRYSWTGIIANGILFFLIAAIFVSGM